MFNVGEPGAHDQRLRGKSVPEQKFATRLPTLIIGGKGVGDDGLQL